MLSGLDSYRVWKKVNLADEAANGKHGMSPRIAQKTGESDENNLKKTNENLSRDSSSAILKPDSSNEPGT